MHFPIVVGEEIADMVGGGSVYVHGRDRQLRPMVVLQMERMRMEGKMGIDNINFQYALIFLIEYIQKYLLLPGRIENIILIVNCEHVGISQKPLDHIKHLLKVFHDFGLNLLHDIYFFHASIPLQLLLKMLKPQSMNLSITSSLAHIASLDQLELQFGGHALNKVDNFFPPSVISHKYMYDLKQLESRSCIKSIKIVHYHKHKC